MNSSQVLTSSKKKYVTSGAHLWVSLTLYKRGTLTSNRLWDEYTRDKQVYPTLFKSKS